MHGADPVHWQSWGTKAIEAASQGNKLMFISSGYFSCYCPSSTVEGLNRPFLWPAFF